MKPVLRSVNLVRTFQTFSQQICGATPLRNGIYRGVFDKVSNTDDAEGRQFQRNS